jgi:hypothetical protein
LLQPQRRERRDSLFIIAQFPIIYSCPLDIGNVKIKTPAELWRGLYRFLRLPQAFLEDCRKNNQYENHTAYRPARTAFICEPFPVPTRKWIHRLILIIVEAPHDRARYCIYFQYSIATKKQAYFLGKGVNSPFGVIFDSVGLWRGFISAT